MLDKNLITSALSKADETGNCFKALESAYNEAEKQERETMAEKEAKDIQQLIAAGVLERDFQGRLRQKRDDRDIWIEDAPCVSTPHDITISSDIVSRTIYRYEGHRYDIEMPSGSKWYMNSVISITELTNRQIIRNARDFHRYIESRNIYRISVGDAVDIIRGRNASDVPKEIKELLRIILRRNAKKIIF